MNSSVRFSARSKAGDACRILLGVYSRRRCGAIREEMGPHSDVDLLVIKRGEFDAGRLVGDIYMHLHGVGQAVDVILVTPEQVERYRNTPYLVIAPALREGKEIYRARALAS